MRTLLTGARRGRRRSRAGVRPRPLPPGAVRHPPASRDRARRGRGDVWAHPTRQGDGSSPGWSQVPDRFEALGIVNGDRSDRVDGYWATLAEELGVDRTAGSDVHSLPAVGRVATGFPEPIPDVGTLVRLLRTHRHAPRDFRPGDAHRLPHVAEPPPDTHSSSTSAARSRRPASLAAPRRSSIVRAARGRTDRGSALWTAAFARPCSRSPARRPTSRTCTRASAPSSRTCVRPHPTSGRTPTRYATSCAG